jgi:hypothetical protein
MKVRELIQMLQSAPPESEIIIKNLDGTTRPVTMAGFRHEDGTEVEFAAVNADIQIVIPQLPVID